MTVTAFHSWWVDAYKRHGLLASLYDDRLLVETQFLKGSIGHYYPLIEGDSEFVNKIKDRLTDNTIDVPKSFSEMRLEEFPNKYVITRNWARKDVVLCICMDHTTFSLFPRFPQDRHIELCY